MSDIETSAALAVDTGAHAAMPSASAIAADPSLSMAGHVSVPPVEKYTPPPGVSSVGHLFKAIDMPPEIASDTAQWFEHGSNLPERHLEEIDATDRAAVENELRDLWGDKYAANVRAINRYLDTQLPPGVGEVIRHARLADGRAVFNDAASVQRLLGQANKPAPSSRGTSVVSQIRSIEVFMRSNRAAYSRDETLQARYRELLALAHSAPQDN